MFIIIIIIKYNSESFGLLSPAKFFSSTPDPLSVTSTLSLPCSFNLMSGTANKNKHQMHAMQTIKIIHFGHKGHCYNLSTKGIFYIKYIFFNCHQGHSCAGRGSGDDVLVAYRQIDRSRQIYRQVGGWVGGWMDRWIDRQGDRYVDRQVDRQIGRQIDIDRQTDRQIDRQIDRERDRQIP